MATKPSKESSKKEKDEVKLIKTPIDLQRLKLEKLMKNPTKEVIIPEKSKDKSPRAPLEFIRNIWGSSAGAGSGDFHVYRGVRRREYARQKFIKEMAEKDAADTEYKKRLEQHKLEAEERTAKKRAKRLKRKQKLKAKKMKKGAGAKEKSESEDDSDDDDDDDQVDRTEADASEDSKAETLDTDESARDAQADRGSSDAHDTGSNAKEAVEGDDTSSESL